MLEEFVICAAIQADEIHVRKTHDEHVKYD